MTFHANDSPPPAGGESLEEVRQNKHVLIGGVVKVDFNNPHVRSSRPAKSGATNRKG